MKKDKKLRLLLVPLIFMVLIFVPGMIVMIVSYIPVRPDVIQIIFGLILGISMMMWFFTFYHVPIGVYIVILAVYTVVSWTWILLKKKGTAMYFIVWLGLGVLSVLLYWKWGDLYYCMLNG